MISVKVVQSEISIATYKQLLSYFQHWGLLLTNEHTDVWVPQVSAVDLFVSSSRINMSEGLVDLQGPNTLVVHPVGGDAPLLAEGPQPDGAIGAARQALGTRRGGGI